MRRTAIALILLGLLGLLVGACQLPARQPPPPQDIPLVAQPSFARDVLPILEESCVKCHNPEDAHGGLRLDNYLHLMDGSNSGPVVSPGNPDQSLLLAVIKHQAGLKMPYHGEKLTPNRIANIEKWVEQGARDN